ncbi:hypothetical protein AVEN_139593-1 [Araneus ventricosus]|uniref:Uncharacterized protein n=1 Tax=Araneus ventricosus TaxID=182803 RepID=A0A4Y2U0Q7_ARAVE|nr:hypothetical protein AVEN_139593-1 [Araneus ventricosus]
MWNVGPHNTRHHAYSLLGRNMLLVHVLVRDIIKNSEIHDLSFNVVSRCDNNEYWIFTDITGPTTISSHEAMEECGPHNHTIYCTPGRNEHASRHVLSSVT